MSLDRNITVASLVSIGKHPRSGRARRADQDGRAVELGLKLSETPQVIHVGDADEAELSQYLGMGLREIIQLGATGTSDAVPILAEQLNKQPVDIVLTGLHAEQGEASGMVPYLLGEHLGWPVVSRVADIQNVEAGRADVVQALPRGQRRLLRVTLPFIATVDNAAPEARQYAFGAARRGALVRQRAAECEDRPRLEWQEAPARPRPKRLNVVKATSAADRFKAATAKPQGQGGKVVRDGSDRDKAEAIMAMLLAEGLLR